MNSRLPPPRRQVPKTFCTTREAAEILGVSLRTVQMWSNSGLLEAWKTSGGHRRLSRVSVERLVAGERPSVPLEASVLTAARQDSQPFRVLVAEDEPDLLRLYKLNLARWALQPHVITADNG